MTDERLIAILNELIEASIDSEQEILLAAKQAREPELIRALNDTAKASLAALAELQDQVRKFGGIAREDGSLKGALRRSWTSIRSSAIARDDHAIMEECERGQGLLRTHYGNAVELDLPRPVDALVERHHQAIVEWHYRLLDLRNRFRDSDGRALRAND